SPALATLPRKIRQGPSQPAHRRSGRELVRRTTLRAMRPFTAYQQDINRQVAEAVSAVGQSLGNVRRDGALELARVLAELRGAGELLGLQAKVQEQGRRIDELERKLQVRESRDDEPEASPGHQG
ncbi:MAG: hypothetical protein ACRDNK_02590, partial [Solirubrobacteraceae bacterium]